VSTNEKPMKNQLKKQIKVPLCGELKLFCKICVVGKIFKTYWVGLCKETAKLSVEASLFVSCRVGLPGLVPKSFVGLIRSDFISIQI
jgi:hypothetical protein